MISDVDGTITRSDVLGHLLPAIGLDWSHPGISQLLTNVATNGYQVSEDAAAHQSSSKLLISSSGMPVGEQAPCHVRFLPLSRCLDGKLLAANSLHSTGCQHPLSPDSHWWPR